MNGFIDDVRGWRLSRLSCVPVRPIDFISIPLWCANESIVPTMLLYIHYHYLNKIVFFFEANE